ncbi:MAG: hypothetical protein WCC22_19655 [Terriglobales bacterium]
MTPKMMKRMIVIRMAAYALAATLVMSGVALADDDDGNYYGQGNPAQARQRGYQESYSNGFRSGYSEASQNWYDGDDRRPHDDWRARDRDSIAYRMGYEDGSSVAREDAARWKPYNSQPRGRYDDRDRGYRREYGSRDRYKMEYTNGYRSGYESVRRDRY